MITAAVALAVALAVIERIDIFLLRLGTEMLSSLISSGENVVPDAVGGVVDQPHDLAESSPLDDGALNQDSTPSAAVSPDFTVPALGSSWTDVLAVWGHPDRYAINGWYFSRHDETCPEMFVSMTLGIVTGVDVTTVEQPSSLADAR